MEGKKKKKRLIAIIPYFLSKFPNEVSGDVEHNAAFGTGAIITMQYNNISSL